MSSSDLVTVFRSEANPTAEIEAISVKNLLESNGIDALLVGDSVLPNLAFAVKVPTQEANRAEQLIADAEQTGPAAADAAELEFEG
jgi:ketopantoate hydroxymethyltransferase